MSIHCRIFALVILIATLGGCSTGSVQVPTVELTTTVTALPHASATFTPVLTATFTPRPTCTSVPTPSEVAPEATFTSVGAMAEFAGTPGVNGKAVVAGLQTLILYEFSFDGKRADVDIRLVSGEEYANPVAVLIELEPRAYAHELILTRIPSAIGPGSADRVVVYSPDTGEVYAEARFD